MKAVTGGHSLTDLVRCERPLFTDWCLY
jgi:hypothetical protein